jgi:glycosyltransferase involved in cell wall biosynthesis
MRSALDYARQHGARAFAVRVAERILGRTPPPETAIAEPPRGGFEVTFALDGARMEPCGEIVHGVRYVQEVYVDFDRLHSVEILMATYARTNTCTLHVALFSPEGTCLAEVEHQGQSVGDNRYTRLPLPKPVEVAGASRLYLVLSSPDGDSGRAVTAWTSDTVRGRLWKVEGAEPFDPAVLREPLGARGIVYRLTVSNNVNEPRYRLAAWPHMPAVPPRVLQVGTLPLGVAVEAVMTDTPGAAQQLLLSQGTDLLLVGDVPFDNSLSSLVLEASRAAVPVVVFVRGGSLRPVAFEPPAEARANSFRDPNAPISARRRTVVAADVVVAEDEDAAVDCRRDRKHEVLVASVIDERVIDACLRSYQRLRLPRVSIVTILYGKSAELPHVLKTYEAQTYPGDIEVVFVDDCSPDDGAQLVEREWERFKSAGGRRAQGGALSYRLIRNDRNIGNCGSRNRGIEASSGDLLVVIDADCLLNRDFVTRHVEAQAFGDCEVSIGPFNIETHGEPPEAVLARYELDPARALADADLQDPRLRTSFLNCITRNFVIRRSAIPAEGLFDPLFAFSSDPASGYGWEDVEMGYRLYLSGARIKFVAEAFSIHVSAPPAPDGNKPARSLLNFVRLLEKHPDFAAVTARWTRETYQRIVEWAERCEVDITELRARAEAILPRPAPSRTAAVLPRRLRVLTYRWHVPHQYELWKLPIDVTVATGVGNPMCDRWEYGQRPLPDNARLRSFETLDHRDFDLAILHFDENVLAHENCNGVLDASWGEPFRRFMALDGIPKLAICHGTPQFYGQYNFDYAGADLMQPIEAERARLVDFLGDVHVVCNSYQAQAEWGFRRSSVIWHGFDPVEFLPATYQRGILSPLGPLVLSRPHYRGYFLYRQVFEGIYAELRPETLKVPEPHPAYVGGAYARAKFQRYVDEIRCYSVYFNPTLRSPMPRARCEPMMCGVATVSARNHDVEQFIVNGVDGFHATDPAELRDQLLYLHRNPEVARHMGAAARDKALQVFHIDRYHSDWARLVTEVCASPVRDLAAAE